MKDSDLDIKLAVLKSKNPPPLTLQEIATFCDISKQGVQQIEARALRKLANEFWDERKTLLAEFSEPDFNMFYGDCYEEP